MNYNECVNLIAEELLSERIHLVTSRRFPGFPSSERMVVRGDQYNDPDVEAAGERVGQEIGRRVGDSASSTFLYRPASLPSDNETIRDVQGSKRIGTQPAHVQWGLDPGHRLSDETGVEIAGPALYTSPHAAVHAGGGRPIFALHAKEGGDRLVLGGSRKEPELSTEISKNLARLAMDRLVTARDRTVERRHSSLRPERYLKVRQLRSGGLELDNPDELNKYVNDYTDPKVATGLGVVDKDWLAREAGMWLSRKFRDQGVTSITTFPTSLKGKAGRVIFPHQERLRSYFGHHSSDLVNSETDWSKLTGK